MQFKTDRRGSSPISRPWGDLGARLLTAAVGGPLLLALTAHATATFASVMLLLCFLAYGEIVTMASRCGMKLKGPVACALGACLLVGAAISGERGLLIAWAVNVLGFAAMGMLPESRRESRGFLELMASSGAVFYVFGMMAFMVILRGGANGVDDCFLLFFCVWANDTAAYFTGLKFGGSKLAPGISPNKSVTGFVAGVAVAAVVGSAWWHWLGRGSVPGAALGLACGLAAQAGDLCESALKRAFGAKDSGNLLPGHGGILDRFDGVLMAAPVLYLIMNLG